MRRIVPVLAGALFLSASAALAQEVPIQVAYYYKVR